MAKNIIVGDEDCQKITDILMHHETFYTKWRDVFRKLNVPFKTLEPNRIHLLQKTTTPESVYHECLQVWRSRESTRATVAILVSALVQCDLTAIADEIREEFIVSPEDGGGGLAKKSRIETTANVIIGSKDCKIISKEFLKGNKKFEILWKDIFRNLNVSTDIACLESWRFEEGENATVGKFISILHRFQMGELADELQEEFDVSRDDIQKPNQPLSSSATWASLEKEKKKILIGRNVTVQQRVTNMKTIFEKLELSKKSLNTFMEKYLDSKLLADLNYDRNPIIFRDTLPVKIQYYVDRSLLSSKQISKDFFKNDTDIFLVSGVARHEMSNLAGNEVSDTSGRQAKQRSLTSRYILLEMETDFQEISSKTEKPVHWLEGKDGVFYWKKTEGDIQTIQQYVSEEQDIVEETEFLTIIEQEPHGAVCLSDTPGMGKSVLLGNLGRELRNNNPDRILIFVILSSFTVKLKCREMNTENVMDSLLELCCTSSLEFEVGRLFFKCEERKIEVICDGLDEINGADVDMVIECLKLINSQSGVRIWVTTRPHLREVLENSLKTLTYNIEPFEYSNQESFLVQYWSQLSVSGGIKLDEKQLTWFAGLCLDELDQVLNDEESSFAGVPLQCLLIAEVFAEDAVNYSNPANFKIENLIPSFCIESIKDLFDRFVIKKLEVYAERYLGGRLLSAEELNDFEESNIFYAMQVMFPEECNNLKLKAPVAIETLLRVGLIVTSGDQKNPEFIHRTFAEYFVAKFVHQVIKQESVSISFTKKNIFKTEELNMNHMHSYIRAKFELFKLRHETFEVPVVMYFLNCLIASNILLPPINAGFSVDETNFILRASVCDNHTAIFHWLCTAPNFSKGVTSEHLFLSVLHGNWELVKAVGEIYQQNHITPLTSVTCEYNGENISLLHAAVMMGNYSNFENLLKNWEFEDVLAQTDTPLKFLLHHCVEWSYMDEEDELIEKEDIITAILKINKSLLEQQRRSRTPLLEMGSHIRLLIKLISSGANVLQLCLNGAYILHELDNVSNSEELDELIRAIPVDSFRELISLIKQSKRKNPLPNILLKFEPLECSLEYFFQHGFDFSCKTEEDEYEPSESLVKVAIMNNRSVKCVQKLLSCGASGINVDSKGRNILHIAAWMDHKQILTTYCKEYVINSRNMEGNTPLHSAFTKMDFTHIDAKRSPTELLISLGADISAINDEGDTPLHLAAVQHFFSPTEEDIKVLLEKGANIHIKNKKGHTPFSHGLQGKYPMSVQKLNAFRSYGAINSNVIATRALYHLIGQSDLHGASEEEYFEFAEYCLSQGADMAFVDEKGRTLFQSAVERRSSVGLNFLLKKGYIEDVLSIFAKDKEIFKCAELTNEGESRIEYNCKCVSHFHPYSNHCKATWEVLAGSSQE